MSGHLTLDNLQDGVAHTEFLVANSHIFVSCHILVLEIKENEEELKGRNCLVVHQLHESLLVLLSARHSQLLETEFWTMECGQK